METAPVPAELTAALLAAGYRVGGPAGVGGGGPVWTASRTGTGDGDADHAPGGRRGTGRGVDPGPAPERVVVQLVEAPTDPDGGPLAQRLRALWSLDHPHLARVVDVLSVDPAVPGDTPRWAVLLAEVPGATVAALLAARGRLTPGEVVTLVVPVAGALDAMHRAGLVHGDVSPANVVVRPDGRPVLIDLLGGTGVAGGRGGPRGTPGFVAPEGTRRRATVPSPTRPGQEQADPPADAPADVFALARVGLAALDLAAADSRLGHELAAACAADPVLRPTAAEVAAACYPCAQPEPITLPDAGVLARTALAQLAAEPRTVSAGGRSRHRAGRGAGRRGRAARAAGRGGRSAAVAAAAAAGVAVLVALTWGSPGSRSLVPTENTGPGTATVIAGPAAATPSPASSGTATGTTARVPDPAAAAADLTRRRAEVLVRGDPAGLTAVSRAGSGAHAADVAVLADLRADEVRIEGLAAVVEGAEVVADPSTDSGPETAGPPATPAATGSGPAPTVHVTVRSGLTAHRRVSAAGAVDVPATPVRAVVLRLVLTEDGWRVEDVVGDP